jgi:hypothetical protein
MLICVKAAQPSYVFWVKFAVGAILCTHYERALGTRPHDLAFGKY